MLDEARGGFDFTLSGAESAFCYGHYVQLGDRGFFGRYNIDRSGTGDFAPLNSWVGNRTDVNYLAAGTNAATAGIALQTNARIQGDWVQARGKYYINTYTTGTTQGTYVAMSPGQLATWAVQADLPICRVSYGKQDFSPGLMLQFARTRTKEYFNLETSSAVPDILGRLVVAGWLPAGIMRYFDPLGLWRVTTAAEVKQESDAENEDGSPEPLPAGTTRFVREETRGPGRLTVGFGFMPWEQIRPGGQVSWNLNDINAASSRNFVGYLRYSSTDLEIGIGSSHIRTHQGPELQQTTLRRVNTPTKETYTTEGWLYLSYNNGRFFLGAELDWFNRIWRFQRSQTGLFTNPDDRDTTLAPLPEFMVADGDDWSGRSRFAPQYWESWRFMVQGGSYWGPGAIRFFYAYLPGQDRRHGILIDRQPFIQETDQAAMGLFDPYSILLSYLYGSGVKAQAYINAASIYSVKFDYMPAANLLLECSLLHARRSSDGYGLGYIRPNTTTAFGSVDYGVQGDFRSSPPGIPETSLGWELMGALMWKLVENDMANWTVEARVSYWQPGRWFNYACVDRSVPNWELSGSAHNWGVNPDRKIDPVLGFELRLGASY
jgi:hypothetical protein